MLASALQQLTNEESSFDEIFKRDEESDKLGIDILSPRRKVIIVKDMIDSLLQGLNTKFSQETQEIIFANGRSLGLASTQNDFQILSNKFYLSAPEIQVKIHLLTGKTGERYPPNSMKDWLQWLSEYNRNQLMKTSANR
ncbi:hypothetical protein PR048_006338 [Dryococelus australis]|uniref:Uncharacterized protein n=1 Tax=Dryococelus australis TaxID=614101 RepID=A0ABQ9ICY3_9NEOP|nr:hypothetical protein PR048_006338 [Dryococelus australis]